MKELRTSIFLVVLLCAALWLAGCGGNSTYSPTVSAAAPVAPAGLVVSPSPAATYPTGTIQFTANEPVTWSVLTGGGGGIGGGGTITSGGLYTAPSDDDVMKRGVSKLKAKTRSSFTVQVQAVSTADPTKSAIVTVTITDLTVTISPSNPTVVEGATQQFTASVTGPGNPNTGVTWFLDNVGGSLSSSGLYTAPLVPGVVSVLAGSTAQSGDEAYTDVTVVPPAGITVSVSPPTTTLTVGQQATFTSTVAGTPNSAVTWSVLPNSVGGSNVSYGTITSGGVFTAATTIPGSSVTVTVQATSQADPSKSATATITLNSSNSAPGPASAVPFALGLLHRFRRRRKAAR